MLKHDIHPIRRQQVFGLLLQLLHSTIIIAFSLTVPDYITLKFIIAMELIGCSGFSFKLMLSKKYRLNDGYPYLLAMKFYSEKRLSRKIIDELGKCGVLFKYVDNEWKVCQSGNSPVQ